MSCLWEAFVLLSLWLFILVVATPQVRYKSDNDLENCVWLLAWRGICKMYLAIAVGSETCAFESEVWSCLVFGRLLFC